MNAEPADGEGVEVRSYFVRGRNALVTRADMGELYMDYYLHLGQHGLRHEPVHDAMLKLLLGALTLHCASRPWNEQVAWTVHFQTPMLNLFAAGDNAAGTVVGQAFAGGVKDVGKNLFLADTVRGKEPMRRSAADFTGADPFTAVEQFYAASEQRHARLFRHGEEDFVFASAQPDCDLEWLASLDDERIRTLDRDETLSLLETRRYRFACGCSEGRLLDMLAPLVRSDPEALFGDQAVLRMSCPRCGARYSITREAAEARAQE